MEEIDEFKAENGRSISYTLKELVAGLHVKIDKFKNCFDNYVKDINDATKKSDKKITFLEAIVGIHTLLLMGLLWIILS